MAQKLHFIIVLLLPLSLSSQQLSGIIYDEETTVKGAKIFNYTKNITEYSNDYGEFSLKASVEDSIIFTSLFHHLKSITIVANDFNDIRVIALKKFINELDEVLVRKEPDTKVFDPVKTNQTLKNQILEDIKQNPHLYQRGSGGGNILAIIGLVAKLFKSKEPKVKEEIRVSASYLQFVDLFNSDSYFNESFLRNELRIIEDYQSLFFEFCEAQDIDSKLLLVKNRFHLLDFFLKSSADFIQIIETYKKG